MALCINGLWEDVVLDDFVPCNEKSKTAAFNHSKSGELWVILLEKAWAKIHGGYANISAGLTWEALRDLTGASAETIFITKNSDKNLLWNTLVNSKLNKFVLTAGSDDLSNGRDDFIEKIGIAGSHAYSLLDVLEIAFTDKEKFIINLE